MQNKTEQQGGGTNSDVVLNYINAGIKKSNMPLLKIILFGIFAGMAIALGAQASSVAMHSIDNVAVARLLGGAVFPVGLMIIVFAGGELFTGDCLMIMGYLDKKFSMASMIKVLVLVYLSNLVGSVLVSFLINYSGQLSYSADKLGAYTIKVAYGKANMSFVAAFASGILCNIFVSIAVLMASAAKHIAGKVWAIFFPIMAFVVGGFEHCVANMYYIPAGMLAAQNPKFAAVAESAYGLTSDKLASINLSNMFVGNLLPVTLGNMVGAMLFVGVVLYYARKAELKA